MKKLWYSREAGSWNEALPIGNGHIGAMVYSGALSDRLQINEETLWSGRPGMITGKHTIAEVEKIRELVKKKKYHEATQEASDIMLGVHSQGYVSYGSMYIDISELQGETKNYRRELDLESGILKCSYEIDKVKVNKEYFVSLKDNVAVINITLSEKRDIHVYQAAELESRAYTSKRAFLFENKGADGQRAVFGRQQPVDKGGRKCNIDFFFENEL